MENIKKILTILVLLGGFSILSYAQNGSAEAARRRQEAELLKQQQERELNLRRFNLDNLRRDGGANRTDFGREPLNKSLALSKKEKELRDKLAAPDAEDVALFGEFLKQPRTGIFRLFPDNDCLTSGVVYISGKCKDIFPGTWLYSFREEDYSDKLIFDLWLKDGRFITDGFLSQGILTELGNFSLNNVTLETTGIDFLTDFKPAENSAEIVRQYEKLGKGIEFNGYKYSKNVEAEVGQVYALRVVAYHAQKKVLDKILTDARNKTDFYFQLVKQDKRKDLTIVFRVVKKEANGVLTIIWKELEIKQSPEIVFSNE